MVELGPGETVTCLESAAEGGMFAFELALDAGIKGPPVHRHEEDEHVEVLEGEIVFVVEGTPRHLRPGDSLHIPAGTPHTFHVPKDGAQLRALVRNGIRFERLVDQHAGGGAAFTRMAMYLRQVDPGASYMVSPAIRAVLACVAWVGRLRGVALQPCAPDRNAIEARHYDAP